MATRRQLLRAALVAGVPGTGLPSPTKAGSSPTKAGSSPAKDGSSPAKDGSSPAKDAAKAGSTAAKPVGTISVIAADYTVRRFDPSTNAWRTIGSRAERICGGGYGLFAVRAGKVWQWTRPGWKRIGDDGSGLAVTHDAIFRLADNRNGVARYDGKRWHWVGGRADRIYGGGLGLFADRVTGLWRFGDPGWTRIGDRGHDVAVTDNNVYAVRDDVRQYDAANGEWDRIGGYASRLYAGQFGLFGARTTGVWRFGNPGWVRIGDPAKAFAVTDNALFAIRNGVERYDPATGKWDGLGQAGARDIAAC